MNTLVSNIYRFHQLDLESKQRIVTEMTSLLDQPGRIGWKENRENYLLLLCKYSACIPLTNSEIEILNAANLSLDNM